MPMPARNTRDWFFPIAGAETTGDVISKLFHENPRVSDCHSAANEGLQNAGDGSLPGCKVRTRVSIDALTGDAKLKFQQLPFFTNEFMDRMKVVADYKSRTDRSMKDSLVEFNNPDAPLVNLVVEDFNTYGLSGKEMANGWELDNGWRTGTRYDWARAVWNVGSSVKDFNKSGSKGLGILTFAVKSGLRLAIYYTVINGELEPNPDLRHRFIVRWVSEGYCYPPTKDGMNFVSSYWGVQPEDASKCPHGFVHALTGAEAREMARRLNISRRDDESGTTLICVSYLENKDNVVKDVATQISKKFWVKIADNLMSCEVRRRENGSTMESVEVDPALFGQAERVDLLRRYRARLANGEDLCIPGECMEASLGSIPKRTVDPITDAAHGVTAMVFVKKTEVEKDDRNTIHVVRRGMTIDYYDVSSRVGFVGFILIEGADDSSKALSLAVSSMENNLHNMLTAEEARRNYERGLKSFLASFYTGIKNAATCLLRNGDSDDIDEDDTPFDKYGWGNEGGSVIPADYTIEVVNNRLEMDGNDVVVPFRISIDCENKAGTTLRISASGIGSDGRTAVKIQTRRPEVTDGGRASNGRVVVRTGAHEILGSVRINKYDCPIDPKLMSIALTVDKEG